MNIFNQSAVIPFRWNNEELEILLITTLKKKKWIIPKGIIEDNMSAVESAGKEAKEEAGIEGEILPDCFGEYKQKKWGGSCRITVYALEVKSKTDKWTESNIRKRSWFPALKAVKLIDNKDLKKIINHFIKSISDK